MSDGTLLIALVLSLVLGGLFSASETALFAMPRARLRRLAASGDLTSGVFRQVLEQPHRVMIGVSLGNSLASVAAVALSAILIQRWFGTNLPLGVTVLLQLFTMTFLLIVFTELGPKMHALEHQGASTQRFAYFVRFTGPVLMPISSALEGIAHAVSRLFAGGTAGGASVEDLQHLIQEARDKGDLDEDEARLFSGAFHLRQLSAADVMMPRADLVAAPASSETSDLIELVNATGHSSLLLYEGTLDRVVGVVFAADLVPAVLDPDTIRSARSIMRPPILVPPTRSLEQLLLEMQRQRLELVVVATSSGETLGVVTIEHIVEEVVGDIQDELQEEEAAIRLLDSGSAIVQANVRVSDVNRVLGTHLASTDGETVESLVREIWSEAPAEGEQRDAPSGDRLTIESMVGHRVWSVRVHRRKTSQATPEVPESAT